MSRIGNKPVVIPAGVKAAIDQNVFLAEGPKGKLSFPLRDEVSVKIDDASRQIIVSRKSDDRFPKALHGLTRAVINNMMIGVTQGYEKKLEIIGVGYIASLQAGVLSLRVGYANEVKKTVPTDLKVTCPRSNAYCYSRLR